MMDLTHYLSDPAFWVTIAFLIFVAGIAKPLYVTVSTALDKRGTQIAEELSRAMSLREEAQATLAQYQKKQRAMMKEAEDILNKANQEARRITDEAEAEVADALAKRSKIAIEKIELAERHALQQVQDRIVDVTVQAARLLAADKLSASARDELVSEAASELAKKLH